MSIDSNNSYNPRLQLLAAYNIDPIPRDFHDELSEASASPSRALTLRSWSKKLNGSVIIREFKSKVANRKPKLRPSQEYFRDGNCFKPLNLYRKEEIATNILKTGIINSLDEGSTIADPYNVRNIARKSKQDNLETRFKLTEPNNLILSSNAADIFVKTNDNYYNYHKNNNNITNNDNYNYDPDYKYNNNNLDNNNDNIINNTNKTSSNTNNIAISLPWVGKQSTSRANTPYHNTANTNTKTSITISKTNTSTNNIIESNNTSAAKEAMIKLREENERKKLNEIQIKKSTIEIKKKINQFRKNIHKRLSEKDPYLANGFLRFFNEKMAATIIEQYKGCSMNIDAFLLLLGNYVGENSRPISSDAEILETLYKSRLEDFIREISYQQSQNQRIGLQSRDGMVHAAGFRTPITNNRHIENQNNNLDEASIDSTGSYKYYTNEYANQNIYAIRTQDRASTAIDSFQQQLMREGVWPPTPVEIVIGAGELDHLKGARGPQRSQKVDEVMEKLFYDQRMRARVQEQKRRASQADLSEELKNWVDESMQPQSSPSKDIKSLLDLPIGASYVPPVSFPRVMKTVDKGLGLDFPAPSPYRSHPGTISETSLILSGGVGSNAGLSLWTGPRQKSTGWIRQVMQDRH